MLKPILLVEDNPKDLELTLLALEKSKLANEVVTVRALGYMAGPDLRTEGQRTEDRGTEDRKPG